jgi:radical SAM superfamily enzyme YgiQ (UPF0313 family)
LPDWSDRENGRVVFSGFQKDLLDLDTLPLPAYHRIDGFPRRYQLPIFNYPKTPNTSCLSSRGCPYQCIYCSKPITGNTWRARSPEDVVAEWRYLVEEMGATEIGITDDVWNLKLDRAKEICHLLIAKRLNSSTMLMA